MTSWTFDQKKAIETTGGKVIVSAAAGSGKTAVLSERALQYVLNGGNINDLLIVTFTEAAAGEMKLRIKNKIIKEYNKTHDEHLKKSILLIDNANISTMDSFYSDIVKENFNMLGIDKNFGILSREENLILKSKVIKKVLDDSFKIDGFDTVLEALGANSIDLIKDSLLKIDSYLESIAFKDSYESKVLNFYCDDTYKNILINYIKNNMLLYKPIYEDAICLMEKDEKLDNVVSLAKKELNYINDLLNINNLDELSSRFRSISFDRMPSIRGYKDDNNLKKYKSVREEFKNLYNEMYIINEIDEKSFLNQNSYIKNVLTILFKVVNNYLEELLKEKKKINKYSFSDVAHFVIDLLIKDGKKTNLAKKISDRYTEILIDEYQDTNNLQNVIFNAISKNNNLFIVGDIKQSIYGFRNADPSIFNNDKASACENSFPMLINLKQNFRSRCEVLNFCNYIFESVMTKDFGDVLYNEDEMLYRGAFYPENKNANTEVLIIDGKKIDEEIMEDELTNYEKEALLVSKKIKELIDSKYEVYDKDLSCQRPIKSSDIVILLRSMTNADLYAKALEKEKISAYLSSVTSYFDNYEVKVIINLLKMIDNLYDDVALLGVIASPLVNVSLDDVSLYRSMNRFESLYDSLSNKKNKELDKFFDKIKYIKAYSQNNTVVDTLNLLYKEFDVLNILSANKKGLRREKNILLMLNYANDFEKDNLNSIHEFINYIENIIINNDTLEGINPVSEKENVLITTIHKSKGLEYPVVFVCNCGHKFNQKDLNDDLLLSDVLGISFNERDEYLLKQNTLSRFLIKKELRKKALSEELRVLYVALTRAKEKLFITGYVPNLDTKLKNISYKIGDDKKISSLYLQKVNSYFDIILACLLRCKENSDLRKYITNDIKTYNSNINVSLKIALASSINEKELEKEMIEKYDFDTSWYNKIKEYKYETKDIPKYLSVSDIKHKDNYMVKPNFLKDGISHTNLGTLYHLIFELLPVKKYDVKTLEDELNNLVVKNKITNEELKMITLEKVFAYLTSNLYDLLLKSKEMYKEKEVTFKVDSKYYDNALNGGKILVSGVIDLLFKYDDTYYIIDYKTDDVEKLDELVNRYKVQLDLYEIAVKDIFKCEKLKKYIYSIKLNKFIEV